MQEPGSRSRDTQRGFALVISILALMLLTFLGLTLATTTSTELQIATNYRWSQQALYNAEAGLEAARIILSGAADVTTGWSAQLPTARTGACPGAGCWLQGAAPAPLDAIVGRDFDHRNCDDKGGVGYGRVLAAGATRYENVSVYPAGGETLNGAFSIWIRRPLTVAANGTYSEDAADQSNLVIVAEGIAPYMGPGDAFTRARQATRVLETRYTLGLATAGEPCLGSQAGQEGGSPMGENFNPCAPLTGGATGSLANAFGGGAAGSLAGTGVQ